MNMQFPVHAPESSRCRHQLCRISSFRRCSAVGDRYAYKVNAVGARNLAQSAESIQAKLIQISTDDVFSSASDTPYNEFDDVNPVGLFAKSKYAGEKFVIQLMTRYVIIRSSWIYGIGKDFLNEVLEAAADPQISTMELLNNDRAVPTSAAELARVVKFFIDNDHYGIYHAVCSGGSCTRLEFAKEILRLAGKEDRLTVTVKDAPRKNIPYWII